MKVLPAPPSLEVEQAPPLSTRRKRWPWVVLLLICVLFGAWWWGDQPLEPLRSAFQDEAVAQTMPFRLAFDAPQELPEVAIEDPEHLVRHIYAALGEGERAKALAIAGVLSQQFPNFQLGQLLYADLLNISSTAPVALPEVEETEKPSLLKRLNELILESKRRLNRPAAGTFQDRVPAALVFLNPQQAHVAAVDASQSRLYWFRNRSQDQGDTQLELVKESYISVGINGLGKAMEGDGKTPTGVYFIQKNLPGETLPDLFGVGALTLNYPNALDLMNKRTGSGIWLHGTPSAQYARAPESTDGCVVLSNPEMQQLMSLPTLRMTPVIIADQLDWVPASQQRQVFDEFKPALDSWLAARNGTDPDVLKSHYSERFEREDMKLAQWWPRLAQTTLGHRISKPLELLSVLQWKDTMQTMVVTHKDPNTKGISLPNYLRTYWQKEAGQWKLVFQGPA